MPCFTRLSRRRILLSPFAAMVVCSSLGCGERPQIESERTAASGQVTLDGRPLPAGSVTLVSKENPRFRVTAMIRQDGTFQVADAPRGEVAVAVETEFLRLTGPPESFVPIPARYGNPATSQLSQQVLPGGPPLSIDLLP